MKKRFAERGLVKDDQLLLSKFRFNPSADFQLTSPLKDTLSVKITPTAEDFSLYTISVTGKGRTARVDIPEYMQELKFTLPDMVPGGYKEIVILNEYYIMNGDNFDLLVYEIIE